MATLPFNISQARELCTAGEWALVDASRPGNISKLDESQLRKHVEQSRKLRDKWKDQSGKQRRDVQKAQKARATDKADRSRRKTELFSAVLSRFTERLAQKFGTAAVGGSSTRRSSKPERAQGHKRQRTQVKTELAQKRTSSAPKASAPKASASKAAAKPKAAQPKKIEQETASQPEKPAKAAAASRKPAQRPPLPPAPANEGLKPSGRKQRRAVTAAKQSKIETSGLKSRIRGHVSARSKRDQARRDSRNP